MVTTSNHWLRKMFNARCTVNELKQQRLETGVMLSLISSLELLIVKVLGKLY